MGFLGGGLAIEHGMHLERVDLGWATQKPHHLGLDSIKLVTSCCCCECFLWSVHVGGGGAVCECVWSEGSWWPCTAAFTNLALKDQQGANFILLSIHIAG